MIFDVVKRDETDKEFVFGQVYRFDTNLPLSYRCMFSVVYTDHTLLTNFEEAHDMMYRRWWRLKTLNVDNYDLIWKLDGQADAGLNISVNDAGDFKTMSLNDVNCKLLTQSFYDSSVDGSTIGKIFLTKDDMVEYVRTNYPKYDDFKIFPLGIYTYDFLIDVSVLSEKPEIIAQHINKSLEQQLIKSSIK